MATVRCPECGEDVSENAQVCPHCGYEPESARARQLTKPARIVFLVLFGVVVLCLVWFIGRMTVH